MKPIQKPYWIFLTITCPQFLLFLIFGKIYSVIGTLLNPESIWAWKLAGSTLGLLGLGSTGYALWCVWQKKPLHPSSGFAILGGYLIWVYYVCTHLERIIPWDIPRWMLFWVAPETFLLTFILPGLLFALGLLVVTFMPKAEEYKPSRDLILLVVIPASFYFVYNMILALLHFGFFFNPLFEHLFPILLILCTAGFFFLLCRLLYGILRKRKETVQKFVNPIIAVLPILGLLLNGKVGNVFGDFTHPAFLILAVVTGILLNLPFPSQPKFRLALFLARGVVFPFTLYFGLVFLPFLPFALLLIIFWGMGFLILAPTLLGFRHGLSLWEDFTTLRASYNSTRLIALFLLSCTLLPGSIYLTIRNDQVQLQQALTWLYRTPYRIQRSPRVVPAALKRALKTLASHRSDDGWGIGLGIGEQVPYLTSVYNWLVLDNLTLSDQKIRDLERVFLDQTTPPETTLENRNKAAKREVIIQNARTTSNYDVRQQCWRSRIDLELTNTTNDSTPRQFAADFQLPSGCYITGYELVINSKAKKGLLADHRAATWVFQQVVNERKDPGILVYRSGNTIALRVFPFQAKETRHTAIELIHATPVTLQLDEQKLQLGNTQPSVPPQRITSWAAFVSPQAKANLPRVSRRREVHFVIDFSKSAQGKTALYLQRVADFCKTAKLAPREVTVTAANYALETSRLDANWKQRLSQFPITGGFNLDRAIKSLLYEHYRTAARHYPVIIVVTDKSNHGQVYEDYQSWQLTFPESPLIYRLAANQKLYSTSLLADQPTKTVTSYPFAPTKPVLAWPDQNRPQAYLPDNGEASIVLKAPAFTGQTLELGRSTWETGLALEALQLGLVMNPINYPQREHALVKTSIHSGIMNRLTSYLVLENAAQEAALLEKQKQILATKKVVDVSSNDKLPLDSPEMAEPPFLLLGLLGAVIYGLRKKLGHKFNLGKLFPRV